MTGAQFGHMQMCPKWATRPVNSPVYVLARPFAATALTSAQCASAALLCLVMLWGRAQALSAGRTGRRPGKVTSRTNPFYIKKRESTAPYMPPAATAR